MKRKMLFALAAMCVASVFAAEGAFPRVWTSVSGCRTAEEFELTVYVTRKASHVPVTPGDENGLIGVFVEAFFKASADLAGREFEGVDLQSQSKDNKKQNNYHDIKHGTPHNTQNVQ